MLKGTRYKSLLSQEDSSTQARKVQGQVPSFYDILFFTTTLSFCAYVGATYSTDSLA